MRRGEHLLGASILRSWRIFCLSSTGGSHLDSLLRTITEE